MIDAERCRAGRRRHGLDALLLPPRALPHIPSRVRGIRGNAQSIATSSYAEHHLRRIDLRRHHNQAVDPRDTEQHPAHTNPEHRLASAHDPLPRHPPVQHGQHLRGRRRAAVRSSRVPRAPYGIHLSHCHATPLGKRVHKILYSTFIMEPGRAAQRGGAKKLRDRDGRLDTDGDGGNNFCTVNGLAFYYASTRFACRAASRTDLPHQPHGVRPRRLAPHPRDFFRYSRRARPTIRVRRTVMLCQGQRRIVELEFPDARRFMFHAHQSGSRSWARSALPGGGLDGSRSRPGLAQPQLAALGLLPSCCSSARLALRRGREPRSAASSDRNHRPRTSSTSGG